MFRPLLKKQLLPGFGLSMGYTVFYLSILVLIPLTLLFFRPFSPRTDSEGYTENVWAALTSSDVISSFQVSLGTALVAACFSFVFGAIAAWVLVRYQFPGKKIIDALVDFPFALPTAVAGICFATLFSSGGWLGQFLEPLGIQVINTTTGITIALIFIGFPFVIRTLQPVLEELEAEVEEAALNLGASKVKVFFKVILPEALPALITGFTLAFSRAVGEYGSVIFIAGNISGQTEIAPLKIMQKLDQFNYASAAAVACILLVFSFVIILFLNIIQSIQAKRGGR